MNSELTFEIVTVNEVETLANGEQVLILQKYVFENGEEVLEF
jgi:hypothetical protein